MPQLDSHQQELINILKAAHQTLAIARKTRTTELVRRVAADKLRIERLAEESALRIKMDLDAELAVHEANLDAALVAAYNNGVPILRMAVDGFGNRYAGAANALLVKLRADGRIGSRTGYQDRSDENTTSAAFPEPINVDEILAESTAILPPTFHEPEELVLVEPNGDDDGVVVQSVKLEMHPRDPWFAQIKGNARPGTPHLHATTCTLYIHPATGDIVAHESRETGEAIWDHPVARWAKSHPEEALAGFRAAQLRGLANDSPLSLRDIEQVTEIGTKLEASE